MKCLYFEQTIGPYKGGQWYENVPDDDYAEALANKLALDVTEAPCGCKLAGGRAVRVAVLNSQDGLIPCQEHNPDAIKPYENIRKNVPERVTLAEAARAAGLLVVDEAADAHKRGNA